MSSDLFAGFDERRIDVEGVTLYVRTAGDGFPLLLLHGYPQSHLCWRFVAPALVAAGYSVIAPDLRGNGASDKPTPTDAAAYRKRVLATELVGLMDRLGHHRFGVVGHDRGSRSAYRIVLDYPNHVSRLVILDAIPTYDQLIDPPEGHLALYHWYLMAQPSPFPEQLVANNLELFIRRIFNAWEGAGTAIDEAHVNQYIANFDADMIAATCADYRAGATLDFADDAADWTSGKRINCPVLALWRQRPPGAVRPIDVWRRWASEVGGRELACGHFVQEEAPDEVIAELLAFFASDLAPVARTQ